ncbi:MAG TPA: N-6 DNA methylase, partial [Chloroflexota bacterium]
MAAPPEVLELVERFQRDAAAYHTATYNETMLRIEFLDPFFTALGWDVANTQGVPLAYREVIHEDDVKVGISHTAPDYGFRTGGERRFFVEAKRPSIKVETDPLPAYQLRRYAWSAGLPLSILTDFEEFAIYDCRLVPNKTDKASIGRKYFFRCTEYDRNWDLIRSLFSRDAVLAGALDEYARTLKPDKGAAPVDTAFLKEIESWREALAKNVAIWNKQLSQRDLNYAVQMTIDRIIFLRIAEDRGTEPYGRLQTLLNIADVYPSLCQLFHQADHRYNSGLFHFEPERERAEPPDDLTLTLTIDDEPLKRIIRSLYFPDSPYEFSVLPVEILGQVYEQFLGKVIHVAPDRRVTVEEKPEVRKAGGVYYTPRYIVDYIVAHTVGKLLEGKTPRQVRGLAAPRRGDPLRVLDPACGSGSFLIGAYQCLLDWYRDQYLADGPAKHTKELYQAQGGDWRLTTDERKRILLDHIYGVDIDPQAVEVTKLSLLLKVLEGETEQTLDTTIAMFHQRALPDLSNNIKCGNSLIAPDFYMAHQASFLSTDDRYRVNVMDWQVEFPFLRRPTCAGFDAVISNPPYIRIQSLSATSPLELDYYKNRYSVARQGNYDIYIVFVARSLELVNNEGRVGLIIPNKFMLAQYGAELRRTLSEGSFLERVVNFGSLQIFRGATTYTCLVFLDKRGLDEFTYESVVDLQAWRASGDADQAILSAPPQSPLPWHFTVHAASALLERLRSTPTRLRSLTNRIFQGIIPGADKVYTVRLLGTDNGVSTCYSRALSAEFRIETELLKRIVSGTNVKRYSIVQDDMRVIYPYRADRDGAARLYRSDEMQAYFPLALEYFAITRQLLDARDHGSAKGPEWYRYIRTQNIGLQPQRKLAVPRLVSHLRCAYDVDGSVCLDNVDVGGVILNDPSIDFAYLLTCPAQRPRSGGVDSRVVG